jgi:hypothetical protein
VTTVKIKTKEHPNWWVQRSITNCGYEIKIIIHEPFGNVPEHVKDSCCQPVEVKR